MTGNELNTWLTERGWKIGHDSFDMSAWYAYKKMDTKYFCQNNDKPPALTVHYYENIPEHTCTVGARGEVWGGHWVWFQFYSMKPEVLKKDLKAISLTLRDLWETASKNQTE